MSHSSANDNEELQKNAPGFGGTYDAVVARNDANTTPRINQQSTTRDSRDAVEYFSAVRRQVRWRESRNAGMSKKTTPIAHLTTKHTSSLNVHQLMSRRTRHTARVERSSLQSLLMILRGSQRNELFHIYKVKEKAFQGNEKADVRNVFSSYASDLMAQVRRSLLREMERTTCGAHLT